MASRDELDSVLIAANPRAGGRLSSHNLLELASWLTDRGMTVEILDDLNQAECLANQLHEQGRLRVLVAAGGDGTLAEVANRTISGMPLAVYPAGTANLVARYLGIPTRHHEFGQMLLDRTTIRFDAGRANGRLFLAVCSCGFDAEVVRRVHSSRTGHISTFTYLPPILASICSYSFPEIRVYCDSDDELSSNDAIEARWAFVSNLPCYAGGLKPGIGADGTDGMLDLCAFKQGGVFSTLRYLPHLFLGTQHKSPDCTQRRSRRFRLEGSTDVPYEVDGDPGGTLPVEIDVVPNRLTLVVPTSYANQRPPD